MTTYNTGNVLGSVAVKDLYDNAQNLDHLVNDKQAETYPDRFGVSRKTWHGIEKDNADAITQFKSDAREAIIAYGYITIDSFQEGAELTLLNQVLRWTLPDGDGDYYRWDGVFPKDVPAGSTPQSTGGIGSGAWISVGDAALRSQLAQTDSSVMIADVPASGVGSNVIKTKYAERDADVYDIIVTYGQSNSAGEAILSGSTAGFPAPLERSLMFDFTDGTIKPIIQNIVSSSGVASSGHAWGEFTNEWYRLSGHGSVVVHCGRGTASIAQLSKGASSGDSDYYGLLISGVNNARARMGIQGLPVGRVYVLFHQGETDQMFGTSFDSYRASFVGLIDNLAADIPMFLFANCTVGCPKNRPETSWATIQNAQRYVCNGRENAATAFDGCPSFLYRDGNVGTEGVHYTQKGYNTMGAGAARGLWSVIKGAIKSKTEADLSQYTSNDVAPWSRAKHCAASTRHASSTSSWQILNINNDIGVMRPSNISSVTIAPDGNSFLFSIADKSSYWFDFTASLSRNAYEYGLSAVAEQYNENGIFYLRAYIYADIDVIVNVNTGELRTGRVPGALPSWLASAISATASSGKATISHGFTNTIPQVSFYSSSTMTDTNATVGVYCPNQTVTNVYAANVSDSQWVAVSLKKVIITPAQLASLGCTVYISGTYAPEF